MTNSNTVSLFSKTRKVAGEMMITDIETGNMKTFPTAQCQHCQQHYQIIQGSGTIRGFCMKCMGPLCGAEECLRECVPQEAQIELYEGNKKTIMKYKDTKAGKRILREVNLINKWINQYENIPILK